MSLYAWLAILFLSVTCSLVGYYLWFYVLKRVEAAVTSSFLFAEPLVIVLFAVAFVGEEASLFVLAGGLLIFVGVYLVTIKREHQGTPQLPVHRDRGSGPRNRRTYSSQNEVPD